MAKLYISIHHHQPRLLATTPPGPETYPHDDAATYLVLQPFVLEPVQEPATGDLIMARDYLRTWSAAKLSEGVSLVGTAEAALIESGAVRPCPVPLPPGADLSFSLAGKTKSGAAFAWADARAMGQLTPPAAAGQWDQLGGDAALGWPAFAALSKALPTVRSWMQLDGGADGPQRAAAIDGLLAVFSRMAEAWAVGDPPRTDDRDLVWTSVVKPQLAKTPLSDLPAWTAYLNKARTGGGTNGSWAYDVLLPISRGDTVVATGKPVISLPGFQWDATAVLTHPELFLPAGVTERGYLDALWSELRGLADREAAAGGTPSLPINQMLGRLFGFGERLAWPIARVDGGVSSSKRIMTLRTDLTRVAGVPAGLNGAAWLATNVVSLTGQVLRLPWDRADPLVTITAADLTIAGLTVKQDPQHPDALLSLLQEGFDELAVVPQRVPALAQASFAGPKGAQHIPAPKPDRIVYYAARQAAMPRLNGHAPDSRVLFAAPEALLDVVDKTQRFVDRGLDGAIVRNAPRRALSRSELLNAGDIFIKDADAWHRRQIELAPRPLTGSAGVAYAMQLVEAIHADEKKVSHWVAALPSGSGFPEAWIWVPAAGTAPAGELLLTAALLTSDADGATLVLDPDPKAAGSLSELLGLDLTQPKAFQAEIAFRTTTDPSGIFDVVQWPSGSHSEPPDLILAKAPLTRLSRSADRLSGALEVTWPVEFDPDYAAKKGVHPDVQALEFSETNKLRLTLALPVGGMTRGLSDPDAQLPLPVPPGEVDRPWAQRGPVASTGPQAWYWLAEHFDQDAGDSHAGEETRFQLWNAAATAVSVTGYLEHQMGHRVGVTLKDVKLARSVDLLSPADVMGPERTGGTPDPANKRRPLLQLSEDGPEGARTLSVTARRDVLQLAHAQYLAGSPGALRNLYRALAELRDALAAAAGLEIAVESWIFDNTSAIGSGASSTLALGMRPSRTDVVQPGSLAGTDLAKLLAALKGSFRDFEALCATLAAGAGPLAVLYTTPSSTFEGSASMLRVRLTLERPAAMRADADWADGAFVPLAAAGPAAGADLATTAMEELRAYLTEPESRLAKSVAWVESADPLADQKGMGPGASKFLVPTGETAPVKRVADLFYLPHAFELPEAHPWLGDRRATADFLAFLLKLAQDILSGRPLSDRLILTDTLSAADAAAHRRFVRGVLDAKSDGAVARMMRLFRRVDVPPATSGATAAERLHWHAGEVLNSLSGVKVPPFELIRRKLLAEPSLFSTLRAIGIGVFNRKIARAPDPAPEVNHSTFTTELIELGLTKHLIDDREVVKEDADRFPASDLQGEMLATGPAYYFVDLLPDHLYDDLVEIKPNTYRGLDPLDESLFGLPRDVGDIASVGDAQAVRGESVLYPPKGAQPTFAANVVHVFPEWRVKEDRAPDPKRLRTYYLLPERVPPPRARSVDALLQDVVCDRTEISLDFPYPPVPKPSLSPNAMWPVQYSAEVMPGLDAVTVASADGPAKSYRRMLKASASTGPARYLPVGVATAGPGTAGWHLLPTYLSHFWFELDLQKPDESWSVNLEDDTYEVEVELWQGTPIPAPDTTAEPSPQDDILLAAYRATQHSAKSAAAPLPPITRAKLEEGLGAWLQSGREGRTLLEPAALLDEKAVRGAATLRSFRVTRPVGDGAWYLSETTAGPPVDGIGAVVGFEVLARADPAATKGPKYDDAVPATLASVLIRITVLDTPALVSRARLRVVRNWRDVGSDGIPDIAREFFLVERYSAWKSEGRAAMVIDEVDFNRGNVPPEGREIRATGGGALSEWLTKIDNFDATMDQGAALPAVLATKVFHNSDSGKDETLWEAWMQDGAFTVDGMILRAAPDPAFVFGKADAPLVLTTRDLALAGDPLQQVSADHLAELLRTLRPSRIKSDRPLVQLVWRDAERMPVLRLTLPLNLKP